MFAFAPETHFPFDVRARWTESPLTRGRTSPPSPPLLWLKLRNSLARDPGFLTRREGEVNRGVYKRVRPNGFRPADFSGPCALRRGPGKLSRLIAPKAF